ncbi:hypothetical protein CPB97_010479 [Podila verticillata]|nr:hypothetical protein CPB97_010479 [Podila verticillata]
MRLRHKVFSRIFRGRERMGGQGSFPHSAITEEQVEIYWMRTIDMDKNQRPIAWYMRLKSLRDAILAEEHTSASAQGGGSAEELAADCNDAVEDDYLSD